uniref:Uncharacterized protein n=1 Tax=Musa acuminata subsp. malaccensis TaxID=214687 RepID=A0A804HN90_MUSAM
MYEIDDSAELIETWSMAIVGYVGSGLFVAIQ